MKTKTSMYLKTKQLGNKGEAFFESLISDYAIVHKIDGSKDVGLDFICEWVFGESPTQLLFGAQVKSTASKNMKIETKNKISRLNGLHEYGGNSKHDFVKTKTSTYWSGFDFPVFLFFIDFTEKETRCYYRRYTSLLHKIDEPQKILPFYLVNEGNNFLAFAPNKEGEGGFCRDLYIDHVRCQHKKGLLTGIDPKNLGLTKHYKQDVLYKGVYEKYKLQIRKTFEEYKKFHELGLF
ncbi:MAG: DUF4365 domain-containing protein [Candidatus Magasanikbacteria bacterium]|nr:DUF4365 domain-containing protein [Candidatus Magasanikbacteria bacterium]